MKSSENPIDKKRLNELTKSIKTINSLLKSLNVPEKILEREIKPFGNAGHIILPKDLTNKRAKVIINK